MSAVSKWTIGAAISAAAIVASPVMAMNIYVGNLSYSTTDKDIKEVFKQYGTVTSARVILDRDTGRSRGFGFVEMPNDDEGSKAIEVLHGADFMGRPLRVNEARPRQGGGGRPEGGRLGGGRLGGGGFQH